MPKVIGKMTTTDADEIIAYGDHIASSTSDSTPINKRVPKAFYAFNSNKTAVYESLEDYEAGVSKPIGPVSGATSLIPKDTIVFLTGESNAYIRLANKAGGLPNFIPIAGGESKIFTDMAEAENYAKNIGEVGEIITYIDTENEEVIVYKIDINRVLTDVATSFLVQLYSTEIQTSYTLTTGQSCEVGFVYNEKYGNDTTNKPGTITYQIKRPTDEKFVTISHPNLVYNINPTTVTDPNDPSYELGKTYCPVYFDPADYGYDFAEGENTIRITVTGGESRKQKSMDFTVNVIAMYLEPDSAFSDATVKNMQIITYAWYCFGEGVEKTVYLDITDDATGVKKTIVKDIGTSSGAYNWSTINLSDLFPGKESYHGTYSMEQYCVITGTIDTDNVIKSDSLYFNIMYCESNNPVPLISASISANKIDYGDNAYITYAVYSYNASTEYTNNVLRTIYYYTGTDELGQELTADAEGALLVVADDATPSATQIRRKDTGLEIAEGRYVVKVIYDDEDVTFKNGAAKDRWAITDYPDPKTATTIFLELSCTNEHGTTAKTFMLELGSVSGDYNLNPASVPTFCYFTSSGKSNASESKASWTCFQGGANTGKVLEASLQNLNYVNNGWIEDDEGAIALHLNGSAKCTIPILFNDQYLYYRNDGDFVEATNTIAGSGRTIVIDFKVSNVLDYGTPCISLINNTEGRGLIVTPQEAYLTNENFKLHYNSAGSISNKDSIPFVQIKDNERIQLTIVIENENASSGKMNTTQFIRMYLNGELSKALSFSSYYFSQNTKPSLVLGSNDATLDVYSVRCYEMALKDSDIIQNFIADRPSIKEKMAEYDKNNIYNTSGGMSGIKLVYDKAKKLYPCFLVTGQLSPIKGNKTKVGIIYTEPASTAEGFETKINCMDYYTKGDNTEEKIYLCETNVQGTSSQIYAKKNYKFKFVLIKTKDYQNVTSYYVKSEDGTDETYCEYKPFVFKKWYGPGNTEYWVKIADSQQSDTYQTTSTYRVNDIVYYAKAQWQCVKACDFTGSSTNGTDETSVFAPIVTASQSNVLIFDATDGTEEGYRYYFVPAGSEFYYRGEQNSNIAQYLIQDENRIRQASALQLNAETGAHHVNIGVNDEISESKFKYKLFSEGNYMGAAESTICVKADYMSPDGINSDNGRLFPKFFEDPIPPQRNNPYGEDNKDCFICIPGFRCLIFQRDTETSEINFIGRYNFNYDKGSTKSFGLENDGDEDADGNITNTTKAQKWEYLDNKDDICNFKSHKLLEPIPQVDSEGKVTGSKIAALSALESTYPDQGDLEDVGLEPDYMHMQVMYSWVLQRANYWEASSETVVTPFTYDGNYYYNERDYRKAIFIKEFERHFKKSHVINYYICVETIALVDNRAKNMFMSCYDVYHDTNRYAQYRSEGKDTTEAKALSEVNIRFTSGSISSVRDCINADTGEFNFNLIDWENSIFPIWYTSLYDMDSCGGVDNNGRNIYNYDVEIHDIYAYDADGNPTYCFNGEGSVFWCMVEDAFGAEIKARWNTLRDSTKTLLSPEIMFNEYMTKGVETLPPVVYNEDQRFKYLDIFTDGYYDITTQSDIFTSIYQYLCQGSKKYHKLWFVEKRISFLDSKYISPQYLANNISFRINKGTNVYVTPDEIAINVTPSTTQYQYCEYGNSAGTYYGGKCRAGETITIKPSAAGIMQDIVFKVFGSNNISSIGDISHLYPSKPDFRYATLLKDLIIGSSREGYTNSYLTSEYMSTINLPLLQKFDISNCDALTGSIDMTGCTNIQEIYAVGTNVPSILVPNGGSLRVMKLPRSVTTLKLQNQKYIENLSLEDYSNLTHLYLQDVAGIEIPELVMKATNLKYARLINVNWVLDGKDVLNKLMACGGLTEAGGEIDKCVLTGSIIVNNVSKVNQELWTDYWASYIADGSLRFTFGESANFFYATYYKTTATDELVTGTTGANGYIQEVVRTVAEDGDATWYCELLTDTFGNGANNINKSMFRPVLLATNTNQPIEGDNAPVINDSVEIKASIVSSYWCVDGAITSYSPTDYYLALEEYNDQGHIRYVQTDGVNNRYKRIATYDMWIINADNTHATYPTISYKVVLKDNNGNIVYTSSDGIRAQPPADAQSVGYWYDAGGAQIIVNNQICSTEDFTCHIIGYEDIYTEFVDEGDTPEYNYPEYPTNGNLMFSHWSPVVPSISKNECIYSHFISGYTSAPLNPAFYKDGYEAYESDGNGNPISYKLTKVESAFTETGNTELVIPKAIDGIPIKALGDRLFSSMFAGGRGVTAVYFETGSEVEYIGNEVFSGCTDLQTIEIPDSVKHLGENVFTNCTATIMWTGNPTITNIGKYAFNNCASEYMKVNCQPRERNIPDSLVTIEEHAFANSKMDINWGSVSKTEVIGSYAFQSSTAENITLPGSLREIGLSAFGGCENLTEITIPRSTKRINAGAFNGCKNLATVTLANGIDLEYIGTGKTVFNGTAFAGTYEDSATHTTANHWVSTSGGKALYLDSNNGKYLLCVEEGTTTLPVDSSTLLIAESACEGISTLATLTMEASSNTKYINSKAFKGTAISGTVTIPNNVKVIEESVFENCISINTVVLGTGAEIIQSYAFANCGVGTVTFNDALKRLEDYAFYNCQNITTVALPVSVEYIGDFVFNKCNAIEIMKVPYVGRTKDSNKTYDSVFGYFFGYQINPDSVKVGDNLTGKTIYFDTEKAISYDSETTIMSVDVNTGTVEVPVMVNMLKFVAGPSGSSIYIRNSVASQGYDTIVEITEGTTYKETYYTFPNGSTPYVITSIMNDDNIMVYNRDYVDLMKESNIAPTTQYFNETEFEEYYIPSSIREIHLLKTEYIPFGAFQNITSLQTFTIDGNCPISDIGVGAFANCTGLTTVNGLSFAITLRNVGDGAFAACSSLTSVELPAGVVSIGDSVFNGCANLATLAVPASLEEIGVDALKNTAIQYNTSGNIKYLGNTTNQYLWAISTVDPELASNTLVESTVGIYYDCFKGCVNMEQIAITQNVKTIYDRAFMISELDADGNYVGTPPKLKSIACTGNAKFNSVDGILYANSYSELVAYPMGKSNTSQIIINGNTTIVRPYACYGVKNSKFAFTTALTRIGDHAFYGAAGLASATISFVIVQVTDDMFWRCSNANLKFEGELAELGERSFYMCANLSGIRLANTIESIPEECFYGCTNLVNFTDNTGTGGFVIPASVDYIGPNAFYGVAPTGNNLPYSISFEMGSNLLSIGPSAFAGVRTQTLAIPETCKSIGNKAFYQCGLTSIKIPAAVETIGTSAFEGSDRLTTADIGIGVNSIGSKAFYGCTSLSTVNMSASMGSNVAMVNIDAFENNAYDRLFVVPNEATPNFVNATNWSTYEIFIIDKEDFESGITTLEVTVNMSDNFGISITKYPTPVTKFNNTTGHEETIYKPELTTIIWGDGTYSWTSYCGEPDAEGNIPVDKAVDGNGKILGVGVSFNRANRTHSDQYEKNYNHNRYVLTNAEYNTWVYTNADGKQEMRYNYTVAEVDGEYVGEPKHCLYDTSEKNTFTVKIVNRGNWKCSTYILGSQSHNSRINSAILDEHIEDYGANMFYGATGMKTISLPGMYLSKYTKVGNNFMTNCSNAEMTAVNLPKSVMVIGTNAFAYCVNLIYINLNNVEEIQSGAFAGCTSLPNITLEKIKTLGSNAFNNCSELYRVILDTEEIPSVTSTTF